MNRDELQAAVDAIIAKRRWNGLRPHEVLQQIQRRKLPAEFLSILLPLLQASEMATCRTAIRIVGNLKGAGSDASEAIQAAWERTWTHGIPQTCQEAFQALLKIGDNDERLLAMIQRCLVIDNYGIHRECAETLMRIRGGRQLLANWDNLLPGKCDCHLHRKLAAQVAAHRETA